MSSGLTLKRARSIAYKMLALRARTCCQVAAALQKKGADEKLAGQVVAELMEAGYVNDYEFATGYISTRLEQKPYGPYYFLAKLHSAGVSRSLAAQALEDIYPPELETEEARRFARSLKGRGETCPQKIARKMANRGFTRAVTGKTIREEFSVCLDIMQ